MRGPGELGDLARPDLPKPTCRVILVCGAPASGKSTYVRDRARKPDIVIDLDMIARERGLGRDRPASATPELLQERNRRLAALSLEASDRVAWVILTAASMRLRQWWKNTLNVKQRDLILLAPPRVELRRRIMHDPDRAGVRHEHLALVDQWLARERANDPGITKRGVDDDGIPTDPLHAWNNEQPRLRWYGLRRWRTIARNQMREHPLCALCLKDNIVTPAYAADHVVPHRGDEHSFWNGALQSLCLAHHNITKQREEIDGFACNVDADGWPLDPRHPSNARD